MTIIEHTPESLAAKIESDEPLTKLERKAIAVVLRKFGEIQKARKKGGANSRKNADLKTDAASVANRERVRAFRARKKTD